MRHGPAKRKQRPGGKQSNLPHRHTPLSEPRPSDIDAAVGHRRQAAAMLRGHVAEWLRSGLQNRLPRFNSGRGLQSSLHRSRLGKPDESCFQSRRGFVIGKRIRARAAALFPGSSVVEQPAVNRLVAGSNPARGANKIKGLCEH